MRTAHTAHSIIWRVDDFVEFISVKDAWMPLASCVVVVATCSTYICGEYKEIQLFTSLHSVITLNQQTFRHNKNKLEKKCIFFRRSTQSTVQAIDCGCTVNR